jgi:hypothetical protein
VSTPLLQIYARPLVWLLQGCIKYSCCQYSGVAKVSNSCSNMPSRTRDTTVSVIAVVATTLAVLARSRLHAAQHPGACKPRAVTPAAHHRPMLQHCHGHAHHVHFMRRDAGVSATPAGHAEGQEVLRQARLLRRHRLRQRVHQARRALFVLPASTCWPVMCRSMLSSRACVLPAGGLCTDHDRFLLAQCADNRGGYHK